MPAPDRLTVLRTILEDGAVPDLHRARRRDSLRDGGRLRGRRVPGRRVHEPRRAAALEDVRGPRPRVAAELPELILGRARSSTPRRGALIASGARFVVGQSFSEEVARLCNRRRIAYIPGWGTATEIATAEELGCEIVKLFPAAAYDGPAFVRNLLAPSPGSKVMPTNVLATEEATRAWLVAGAACLGVAGHLYPADLISSRDREEIARRTRTFLGWVGGARAGDARATGS